MEQVFQSTRLETQSSTRDERRTRTKEMLMPDYSLDNDESYWNVPERFKPMLEHAKGLGISKASYFYMGDENDESTPLAVILQMDPGFVINKHAHGCERFEVIVRGSVIEGDNTYVAGDVMTSPAYELYGPKVAGPDGATTVEVFATSKGHLERVVEDSDGNEVRFNILDNFRDVLVPGRNIDH
jgi:hypothetical protein